MTIEIKSCPYVELTSLVPDDDWLNWFFYAISENAPFSWGDNNRTMVTVERFRDHCNKVFDVYYDELDTNEKENFLKALDNLDPYIYIDLEN